MTTEDERLKDAFMDMLNQACGEWKQEYDGYKPVGRTFLGYDSQCMSSYEAALALAVEFGWIQQSEVIR